MIRRFLGSCGGVKHLAQHVASGEEVEDKAGRHKPLCDGVKVKEETPEDPSLSDNVSK